MDDGYEICATLTFDLSDDELTAVVAQLMRYRPEMLYPEAWRRLTDELRGRARWFPQRQTCVQLSAAVFEDLPDGVQDMLRAHQVARPPYERELGPTAA